MMSLFSDNLTKLLQATDTSQRKLAQELGIPTSSVSRYCSGEQMPRTQILDSIASFFEVSVSDLMSPDFQAAQISQHKIVIDGVPLSAEDVSILYTRSQISSLCEQLNLSELQMSLNFINKLLQQRFAKERYERERIEQELLEKKRYEEELLRRHQEELEALKQRQEALERILSEHTTNTKDTP